MDNVDNNINDENSQKEDDNLYSNYEITICKNNKNIIDGSSINVPDDSNIKLIEDIAETGTLTISWEHFKSTLISKIVESCYWMYEQYGGLNNQMLLYYSSSNYNKQDIHDILKNSNETKVEIKHGSSCYDSSSCSKCNKEFVKYFINDIINTLQYNCIKPPPTLQRICEIICKPSCYKNTTSYLYALDKLVNVALPTLITSKNRIYKEYAEDHISDDGSKCNQRCFTKKARFE
ncbi:hypothetical protein ACR3K2_27090 [Cryptosporidium serpentis]